MESSVSPVGNGNKSSVKPLVNSVSSQGANASKYHHLCRNPCRITSVAQLCCALSSEIAKARPGTVLLRCNGPGTNGVDGCLPGMPGRQMDLHLSVFRGGCCLSRNQRKDITSFTGNGYLRTFKRLHTWTWTWTAYCAIILSHSCPMDPSTFLGSVWDMIWGVKMVKYLLRRCLDP